MNLRNWAVVLGVSAVVCTSSPASEPGVGSPISWKRTTIDGHFRSEGVAAADLNRDGRLDVLIGDSWYESPSWTRHDIRKPGEFGDGLHSYSESMAVWADDINRDGWPDQVLVGFPGKPAYWYENPKGKPGHWPRHEIWHSACNETPLYTDLLGDGRRVLVMGWQPEGKEDEGQMAWFGPGSDSAQTWEMHPISEASTKDKVIPGTFKFAHGLGAGDLNGDGRKDVICTAGWWEQPASAGQATKPWAFHPAKLGDPAANMIAYDVNGDGKNDVIDSSAHKFGIWWFEQGEQKDGSPEFTRHALFPELISETHALIAADIDGDRIEDLVTGKRFWSHGKSEPGSDKPPRVYWLKASRGSNRQVTFEPREIDDQSGVGTQFQVVDFNGDGLLDVVTSNKKGVFLLEQFRKAN